MSTTTLDIIDHLAGIQPNSRLDKLRAERPQARENAQKSYLALFEPAFPSGVTLAERFAIATFVAGLHRQSHVRDFYAAGLGKSAEKQLAEIIAAEILCGTTEGPYGRYPEGPLLRENKEGLKYEVFVTHADLLGPKLVAALEHAHLLVFRPRDASSAALQKLIDAGWSTTDIVTISQLVAFLSFQIRVVAGLSALASATRTDVDVTSIFTGVLATGTV
ncbi:CMD domain protein [Microvirga sp. 2YAF29]|uniref:CMD domain protein n=1 Tax=Microvirga sp. 2YAF29 TaxID=3233031 RepID=UPI003F96976F